MTACFPLATHASIHHNPRMAWQFTFVLVHPLYPGNIGSAARALSNFGFADLRVVTTRNLVTEPDAEKMAVGGIHVLQQTRVFPALHAAIADCHSVIGASRRTGQHRPQLQSVYDLAPILAPIPDDARIAILFGSEEKGLTNEELELCHHVICIPSMVENPSLNLAHAVGVFAYELRRPGVQTAATSAIDLPAEIVAREPLATQDALEGLYAHLELALERIAFFPHGNPGRIMRRMRQLFGRTALHADEVRLLRGIARQIEDTTERLQQIAD